MGRNERLRCAVICAAVAGWTASAEAQTASDAPPEANAGDAKILDPISITATRNPIAAFEYPGMVSVVDRERIRTFVPSTPDDILRFLPNVEFVGGPRRTGETPVIRGFSGPDVVTLIDGTRQNFGSAHDGRFFVDPSLLRQVEVLRGPASSLYGSGGTGGVIEFRTVDAADFLATGQRFGSTVSAGYQDVNNERVGTASLYALPMPGLDFIGSITKRDSGSIELGDGNKLSSTDDDILAGLLKASYQMAAHHRLEGSFIAFDNNAQEPNNGQGAGGVDVVDKDIRALTFRTAYSYSNPADRLIDLDVVAYHTRFQADELRLDNRGAGPAGELLRRDVDTTGARVDNRSRFDLSAGIGVTLTYGGEAYEDRQDGQAGAVARDGVPDAKATFLGAFAQAEVVVARPFGILPGDLLIIPGARFDDFETSSGLGAENGESELSPRISASYLPTDWLMGFASYSEAFRAPTFDEVYLTGVHFRIPIGPGIVNRFVPNPALRPQRTRTLEFGGGLSFRDVLQERDRLRIKGSHFRIDGRDFIDLAVTQPTPFVNCNPFIPGNCNGTTTSSNVPEARLRGSEIEAAYESNRVFVALGLGRIDGENERTGAKLGVLTPDELTLDAGVFLPAIDSLVGWRLIAADDFDNVNNAADRRDGYAVHDFYFSWTPEDGHLAGLRVDLGLDNAFDKAYARAFTGATEAGRNAKILVGYSVKW